MHETLIKNMKKGYVSKKVCIFAPENKSEGIAQLLHYILRNQDKSSLRQSQSAVNKHIAKTNHYMLLVLSAGIDYFVRNTPLWFGRCPSPML